MTRLARHSAALAKRNLIGVIRNPEALIDVTLQPIIFIAAVHVRLRRRDRRRLAARLPAVPAPRHPRPDDRLRRHRDRRQPQLRHREGRLRPLPLAADRPLGAAGRRGASGDVVRYVAAVRDHARLRLRDRLPRRRPTSSRCSPRACWRSAFALCLCWISVFVGMIARTPGAVQGILLLAAVPADVRRQHVRPGRHAAELAADVHRRQPDDAPGRQPARAAARRRRGERHAVDAGLDGRDPARSSCRSRYAPTGAAPDVSARDAPRRGVRRAAALVGGLDAPPIRASTRATSGLERSSAPRSDDGGAEPLGGVLDAARSAAADPAATTPTMATIGMSVVATAASQGLRRAASPRRRDRRPRARRSPRAPRRTRGAWPCSGRAGAKPLEPTARASADDLRAARRDRRRATRCGRAIARTSTLSSRRRSASSTRAQRELARAREVAAAQPDVGQPQPQQRRRRRRRSSVSSSSVASSSTVSAPSRSSISISVPACEESVIAERPVVAELAEARRPRARGRRACAPGRRCSRRGARASAARPRAPTGRGARASRPGAAPRGRCRRRTAASTGRASASSGRPSSIALELLAASRACGPRRRRVVASRA